MASLRTMRSKWYARIRIWDGFHQKEKLIPLRTDSKTEARARLAIVSRVENDIKNGMGFSFPWLNENGELTVKHVNLKAACRQYIESRSTEGLSSGSLRRYQNSLDNFICVIGPKYPIASIEVTHIESFKSFWAKKHKPNGINIDLRHLKTFMKWCFEREFVENIPKIVMVKSPKTRPQYISDSDFDALVHVLDVGRHYRKAFYFYRSTGCRLSEPFYGTLEGNWLLIPAQNTKAKIEKEIHLADDVIPIWKEMKSRFDNTQYQPRNFINRYSKEFLKACISVGLDYHFHNLRHTFAVRRYLETGDIYRVKMEMGHSTVATTEKYAEFSLRKLAEDFPSIKNSQKAKE